MKSAILILMFLVSSLANAQAYIKGNNLYVWPSGQVAIGTKSPQAALDISSTGTLSSVILPRDTTANRPVVAVNGMIRYNTNTAGFEGYAAGAWGSVGQTGTITSILKRIGLVSGTITTTGTIDVDVGTSANKILQLTTGAQIPAVDGFLVTNLNVSASDVANKELSNLGTTAINADLIFGYPSPFIRSGPGVTGFTTGEYGTLVGENSVDGPAGSWIVSGGVASGVGSGGNVLISGGATSGLGTGGDITLFTGRSSGGGNDGGLYLDIPSKGTQGQPIISVTTSGKAVWGALSLNGASTVSGVLPVANGGTGAGDLTGFIINGGQSGGITISATGALSIGAGGNIVLAPAGALSLSSGTGVNINSVGFITMQPTAGITINPTGSLTLGSAANITAATPGAMTLSSGATGITINSAGFVTIQPTGGLTINPTGNLSLGSGGTVVISPVGALSLAGANVILNPVGRVGIGTTTPIIGSIADFSVTGTSFSSIILPRDSSANRPTGGVNGMARYNTNIANFEGYVGGVWGNLGTGLPISSLGAATGGMTLGNGANQQVWQWDTEAAGVNMTFGSTATGASSVSSWLFQNTGAGNTATTMKINNSSTGTGAAALVVTGAGSAAAMANFIYTGTSSTSVGLGASCNSGSFTNNCFNSTHSGTAGYAIISQITRANIGTQIGLYNAQTAANNTGTSIDWFSNRTGTANTMVASIAGSITDISSGAYKGAMIFYTANNAAPTEVMRIDSLGRVGIGTTTPRATLDVQMTGSNSGIILPSDTTANRNQAPTNGIMRYNSNTSLFEVYENSAWTNFTIISDVRAKTNVETVKHGLEMVSKMRPVFFDWNRNDGHGSAMTGGRQVGFIAQEMEKILPEVVDVGGDTYRTMRYGQVCPVAISAIQELTAIVNEQDKRIKALERRHGR